MPRVLKTQVTGDMKAPQATARNRKAPSDDKSSPPLRSPAPAAAHHQAGIGTAQAKEAGAGDSLNEDHPANKVAGSREAQATRLSDRAADEGRRAVSANAVVQQSPEQLSPIAPDKLTVDKETGFRNVSVSPPAAETSGLEQEAASKADKSAETALEGLEPGREQLGKVGCSNHWSTASVFTANHFVVEI